MESEESALSVEVGGIVVHQEHLSAAEQVELLEQVRRVVRAAPLFRPETRTGRKMSVRMTSAGHAMPLGCRASYR